MAQFGTAIARLRNVLGEATYESFARQGEAMNTAEIVAYAYDQIDRARAELNALGELRESCVQRDSGAGCFTRPQQSCP